MPPRRPRSAVATAPLPTPRPAKTAPMKSTTAHLRLPPSRRRKAARARNFFRLVLVGGMASFLLGITAVGAGVGYLATQNDKVMGGLTVGQLAQGLLPLPERENVLLMGTDYSYTEGHRTDNGPVRSDTMMVASFDPNSHHLSILSIPRDTKVLIHGHYEKINAAFAMGGGDLALKTVSGLVGVPITRWASVNTGGLEKLVDVIGGVKIYVDKDMYYVDETAHLGINIHKGWHNMNGKQAHQYVRFRHDELGDIGRVQRQQQFMRAAAESMLNPFALLKVPQLIATVRQNITTNMSTSEILQMGTFAARMKRQDVKMVMLPGEFSGPASTVSYWLVDPAAAEAVGRRVLSGTGDAEAANLNDRTHVKVTVLNASPYSGVATAAAKDLRAAGWNVWSVGDAPRHDLTHCRVINEVGQDAMAARIAKDLGVHAERVDASVGDVSTDFTVMIGADWARAHNVATARIP